MTEHEEMKPGRPVLVEAVVVADVEKLILVVSGVGNTSVAVERDKVYVAMEDPLPEAVIAATTDHTVCGLLTDVNNRDSEPCTAAAEYGVLAVRDTPYGTEAAAPAYLWEPIVACEEHVGKLLRWVPETERTQEVYWQVVPIEWVGGIHE